MSFRMHAWNVVSISDHLRIFDILLRACSVLQLHLVFFFLEYSINGYLISYKYFLIGEPVTIYRFATSRSRMCNAATSFRVSETQISKSVYDLCTWSLDNSDVICHVYFCNYIYYQNRSNHLCITFPYFNTIYGFIKTRKYKISIRKPSFCLTIKVIKYEQN